MRLSIPTPDAELVAEVLGTQVRFFRDGRMLEGDEEASVLRLLGIRDERARRLTFGWVDHPAAKTLALLCNGPVRLQDPKYVAHGGKVVMHNAPAYETPVRHAVVEEMLRRDVAERYEEEKGESLGNRQCPVYLRLTDKVDVLEALLEILRQNIPVGMLVLEEIERRALKACSSSASQDPTTDAGQAA